MSSMKHWDDDRINESSGLAYSRAIEDQAYVCNDEDGILFVVRPSTAKTLSTFSLSGNTLDDPEDLSVDFAGDLWVADIGDNSDSRSWVNLYRRGEPGTKSGSLKFTHYRVKYDDGNARNAEAFVTFPNGDRFIITKGASFSRVFKLPKTLKVSPEFNIATQVASGLPTLISGACASKDGKWAFCLREGHGSTIYILNAATWADTGDTISMSSMDKPEGISTSFSGKSLSVCDDNSRTPGGKLQISIRIPDAYLPAGTTTDDAGAPTPGAPGAPAAPVNPCAA